VEVIKIKRILLATLFTMISLSIVAVSAEIGVWLDDTDIAEGDNATTESYVECYATENGYSQIDYDYDREITNSYYYSIRWHSGYPNSTPGGSSASLGTDMEAEAQVDLEDWYVPMWINQPDTYSHAFIDG